MGALAQKFTNLPKNRIIEIQADGSIIDFKGSYEEFSELKSSQVNKKK